MQAVALSKGLPSLGSLLPSTSIDRSRAWTTTSQLIPASCGWMRSTPPRKLDALKAFGRLHLRFHWSGSGARTSQAPSKGIGGHCRCGGGGEDGGGGGGTAGSTGSSDLQTPTNGARWRLEEGGTEAHSALNVVLVSPQIPGNAGSIARTCAAAGVRLHLVEPMAFQLDDAKLKRAGLDYWPYVCVAVHSSWAAFLDYFNNQPSPKRLIGFSKKAQSLYTGVRYQEHDWLLFGSETSGFPPEAVEAIRAAGELVRIPMSEEHVRSLNLSVSVGIGLFESLRQLEMRRTPHEGEQQQQDSGTQTVESKVVAH